MVPALPDLQAQPSDEPSTPGCVVLLGDAVKSRKLTTARRRLLQERLRDEVARLNVELAPSLLSPVEIREGDSLRTVLSQPQHLAQIFWALSSVSGLAAFRMGVAYGTLQVFRSFPDDVDGIAYHLAREAREETRPGAPIAFSGFGARDDAALRAISNLLLERYQRLSERQREAVTLLRGTDRRADAAEQLGISRPSLTNRLQSAGWDAIRVAEHAMAFLLEKFDRRAEWMAWRR